MNLTEAEARSTIALMNASRKHKEALLRQWTERQPEARFTVYALSRRKR